MRSAILFTVLFLFTFNIQAQTQEQLEAWAETGYSMQKMYAEPDFNVDSCLSSPKMFSACLMTIEGLVNQKEGEFKEVVFDGATTLSIIEVEEDALPKTYEESVEFQEQKRKSFMLAHQLGATTDLEVLLATAFQTVLTEVKPAEQHYIAGEAYGAFLREAYDPHNGFRPRSLFYPKPNEFFGIGAEVTKYNAEDENLKGSIAVKPIKGSPADKAGLVAGDLILKVDGVEVADLALDLAVDKIKGPVDSEVALTIHSVCENKEKEIRVTRGPISHLPDWMEDSHFVSLENGNDPIADLCAGKQEPEAGEVQALYVPMSSFQGPRGVDLCDQFIDLQIRDLQNSDSIGMILDLRGNPGGLLDEAACMLDSVIEAKGPIVGQVRVVKGQVVGNSPEVTDYFSLKGPLVSKNVPLHYNKKIIVLVDSGSASASEIFAGTFQDMRRGWVLGEITHGKGSVQTYQRHSVARHLRNPGDAPIMIGRTTAVYTLNSGRSPQRVGVIPDFFYDDQGKEVEVTADTVSGEAQVYGSIVYNGNRWTQTRESEIETLKTCAMVEESHGETLKAQMKVDERYIRPYVASYQMDLAKDILNCSPERTALK